MVELTCKDGIGRVPLDGWGATHNRSVAGSRPASPTELPPSSAHSGRIRGGRTISRPCGPGALSRAISENQVAATPPMPHFNCRTSTHPAWLALVLSGCSPPPTCRLGDRNDFPTRAIRHLRYGKHPPGCCRLTSSGPGVVSTASMRRHGTGSPDAGEDGAQVGRMLVASLLAGRREHGHGERRAGQGRRRGLPLWLSAAWRARWHDGVLPPRPERSASSGGSRGVGTGNPFAAWQNPNRFTEEIRAAFHPLR